MPILALDPRELTLLSALAQEPPAEGCPLGGLLASALRGPWGEVLDRSLPAFLERRLVLLDGDGAPHLSPALEPLMATLHSPEQALSFGRQGSLAVAKTLACRRGPTWALVTLPRDAELVTLTYPLERAQLASWFRQELLAGLPQDEETDPTLELELALGELLILLGMQAVYRERAMARAPLSGADLWVGAPELAALTADELLAPWEGKGLDLLMGAEAACSYWANEQRRQQTAARLVERGILWATRNSWALSEELRPLLDPGRLLDLIWVREHGDDASPTLLLALDEGCLLVRASPVSPLHVRLTAIAGAPDAGAWFDRLVPEVEKPAPEQPVEEPTPKPTEHEAGAPNCARCGAELRPGQRFCGNCGAPTGAVEPTPETPMCPECGAPAPGHARFCPECGAGLESD